MRTIERICNAVRNHIEANPDVDFQLTDDTVNGLLAEASKTTTKEGKMVLFFNEEDVTLEYEFCGRLRTEPPSFTRIVTVCGKGLDYFQQYPTYDRTTLL